MTKQRFTTVERKSNRQAQQRLISSCVKSKIALRGAYAALSGCDGLLFHRVTLVAVPVVIAVNWRLRSTNCVGSELKMRCIPMQRSKRDENMKPLVSIIIDNYNYARFLPAAIDSAI